LNRVLEIESEEGCSQVLTGMDGVGSEVVYSDVASGVESKGRGFEAVLGLDRAEGQEVGI
jgi:hypothetical protein